jgi:Icc-related predicted phosphoesterase
MRILALSDQIVEQFYNPAAREQFENVDVIIGCGDLPYEHLEYLVSSINKPLFYVPGNHDPDYNMHDSRTFVAGGTNLDLKVTRFKSKLLAGFGGSVRYRPDGSNQYSQSQARIRLSNLFFPLWMNRLIFSRRLDLVITHSPPLGIHDDKEDPPHHGLSAINTLIKNFQPRYVLHGHTHHYMSNMKPTKTVIGGTTIINVYPYKIIEIS